MKPYLFAFLLLLAGCTSGCEDEVDKTFDPTVMPDATTTGKGTLGFLYNGWVYSAGRFYDTYSYSSRPSKPLYSSYHETIDTLFIEAIVKEGMSFKFKIPAPRNQQKITYKDGYLGGMELPDGEVTITRFDKTERIASGLFEGGRLTKGRFDIKFDISTYSSE